MVEQATQPLHDGEAETQSAVTPLQTFNLVELGEDIPQLVGRNAGPAVPKVEAQRVATPARTEHDAAIGGVANGIGTEVQQYSLQEDEVAVNPGAAGHRPQPQVFLQRGLRERCLQAVKK